MSVSVIIPTHERPELLSRALASVRRQTRPPDEVLVVSDGDACPPTAPGCRIVALGANTGGATARNVGARQARSEWLAFLDDDDEWNPRYLENALHHHAEAELVLTGFDKVRSDGEVVPEKIPPSHLEASEWMVRNQGLRGSNLLVRRELFAHSGGFDEVLTAGQDMDLAVRVAALRPRYVGHAERLVTFHAHGGQRISTPGPRNAYGWRTFLAIHGRRMSSAQGRAFRERTRSLFGSDPGEVPTLVWVLGPPGGGKTSWARRIAAAEGAEVLGLASLLQWASGADHGVLSAKRHLVAAIREVELRRGPGERRLFVDSAYLPPEALRPLGPREHVVALVPPRSLWEERLCQRNGQILPAQSDEYSIWAGRFGVGAIASHRADAEAR